MTSRAACEYPDWPADLRRPTDAELLALRYVVNYSGPCSAPPLPPVPPPTTVEIGGISVEVPAPPSVVVRYQHEGPLQSLCRVSRCFDLIQWEPSAGVGTGGVDHGDYRQYKLWADGCPCVKIYVRHLGWVGPNGESWSATSGTAGSPWVEVPDGELPPESWPSWKYVGQP